MGEKGGRLRSFFCLFIWSRPFLGTERSEWSARCYTGCVGKCLATNAIMRALQRVTTNCCYYNIIFILPGFYSNPHLDTLLCPVDVLARLLLFQFFLCFALCFSILYIKSKVSAKHCCRNYFIQWIGLHRCLHLLTTDSRHHHIGVS